MRNLAYLQSELNKSKAAQLDQSLYQVLNGILGLESQFQDGVSQLEADPLKFVLDKDTGLYLQNTDQSGPSEFPWRVDLVGKIYERFRTIALGDWTAYTPTWVSSGVQPTLGASVATGQYALVGNICLFNASLTLGAGFAFGTGGHGLTLPFAANASAPTRRFGTAEIVDTGTGIYFSQYAHATLNALPAAQILALTTAGGALGNITAAVPIVWIATDIMSVSGVYRI